MELNETNLISCTVWQFQNDPHLYFTFLVYLIWNFIVFCIQSFLTIQSDHKFGLLGLDQVSLILLATPYILK